eukprot:1155635-Pelagomonas_calceolata.AAC.22
MATLSKEEAAMLCSPSSLCLSRTLVRFLLACLPFPSLSTQCPKGMPSFRFMPQNTRNALRGCHHSE